MGYSRMQQISRNRFKIVHSGLSLVGQKSIEREFQTSEGVGQMLIGF